MLIHVRLIHGHPLICAGDLLKPYNAVGGGHRQSPVQVCKPPIEDMSLYNISRHKWLCFIQLVYVCMCVYVNMTV